MWSRNVLGIFYLLEMYALLSLFEHLSPPVVICLVGPRHCPSQKKTSMDRQLTLQEGLNIICLLNLSAKYLPSLKSIETPAIGFFMFDR